MDLFDFADDEEATDQSATPPPRESRDAEPAIRSSARSAKAARKEDPGEALEQSDWNEVPQALFLSWSEKMQFAYCAARDIDSASHAETAEEIEWFLARARSYQKINQS